VHARGRQGGEGGRREVLLTFANIVSSLPPGPGAACSAMVGVARGADQMRRGGPAETLAAAAGAAMEREREV
jgi:hypothetical protein